MDTLRIPVRSGVKAHNAGLFISAGRGMHPHRVINSHELIFVRSGVLKIYEDGIDYAVGSGQSLILAPGLKHGGLEDYGKELSFYWIHFDVAASRKSPDLFEIPKTSSLRRPERMTELFRIFLDEQESGNTVRETGDMLLGLMLLETVAGGGSSAEGASSSAADEAERLIRVGFREPITTASIAKKLKYNPDYLGRIFHLKFGATVIEAIHRMRIRNARKLLMNSSKSIKEIALESGFRDSVYFRRIFLRGEGMTPRAFRKLYSKYHVNTE